MTNVIAFAQNSKEVPHNIEAEQGFLGTVLLDNSGADTLLSPLVPDDFYEPVHGRIWQAFQILRTQGRVANPTTLKQYFATDPANDALNIPDYLKRLCAAAIGSVVINDYCDLIRDLRQKRDLIRVCQMTAQRANDARPDETAETLAEGLQGEVMRLVSSDAPSQTDIRTIAQGVLLEAEKAMREKKPTLGVPTMLRDLDARLGGLQPKQLVILAGRPGMGKSALAGHISYAAAWNKVPTAVFSLEMSSSDWAQRIAGARSGIPYNDIRNGKLDSAQFQKLHDMIDRMSELPLFIDETPQLSLSTLRARATRLKATVGLGLIVVDYLGLMKPEDRYKGNKVAEVSEISAGLKGIAKSLDVPVLALSQLNRQVEQRDNKRPFMADLRDSGSIEQDADVVLFAYREEYYLRQNEPTEPGPAMTDWMRALGDCQNITEVHVAKQRHGSTGVVRVFGDMATSRYSDLKVAS
jgi:replicative DNA helicase